MRDGASGVRLGSVAEGIGCGRDCEQVGDDERERGVSVAVCEVGGGGKKREADERDGGDEQQVAQVPRLARLLERFE